ncbi:MAG: NAD(P)H-dependent glycerol-3-phosphate dehydrogenase [Gammaproteobacteria bacterium]|nr:NAD(P)H-dependent glycerol-3-phosphate dehydrogenase [Gammaproteobacteria bacterium]
MSTQVLNVGIVGAGAWGSTIAKILGENGISCTIYTRSEEVAHEISVHHTNQKYLPAIKIPPNVCATTKTELVPTRTLIIALPAVSLLALSEFPLTIDSRILILTKGLTENGMFISTYIEQWSSHLAVLSGPNLAGELSRNLPAATVIASRDQSMARMFQSILKRPYFRIYLSDDPTGVELCGVYKNVIALAVGLCDGLGLGANARSALITRGISELLKICRKLKTKPETCFGLAGIGDIMATAHSHESRNYQFGYHWIKPNTYHSRSNTAEGYRNVKIIFNKTFVGLDLPIAKELYFIFYEHKSPMQSIQDLLARPSGYE